jgi:hypothetical protein
MPKTTEMTQLQKQANAKSQKKTRKVCLWKLYPDSKGSTARLILCDKSKELQKCG